MFSIFQLLMIIVLRRENLNKDTVTSTCINANQSKGFDKNKEHRFLEPSCQAVYKLALVKETQYE